MSEPIKKPGQQPESYSPKDMPEIMKLAEQVQDTTIQPEAQPILERFEIAKCGPYRFIGKSFYGRMGKCNEFCAAALKLDWVFNAIDELKEYATEDIYDAALVHWDKWDEKNKLMGYTVGRFMKADTPVPEDMDYVDIAETLVAKYFIRGGNENIAIDMLRAEFMQQGIYKDALWKFEGEIFTNREARKNNETSDDIYGAYLPCELLNPPKKRTRDKIADMFHVRRHRK